ncbi:NAD synthetase [Alkalilimnicola sp. S0819]|uniref:NAD synthetase n=1 Tax=Alkalilimnicola sp. S0819 TaxID=2613922 RepID=UPI0012627C4B|nr:NAD synthetase [Alkalilimnicola sp. S0819]KAB7624161.1 NAD synthetase [Alkalilimnicola sp. S0819]MPQ16414.1 NAD synthetase [Alkalilimnicola sp. S0819]
MSATAHDLIPSLRPKDAILRDAALARFDVARVYAAIDADPALVGAGVVYLDERLNAIELRPFRPLCRSAPIKIVLRAVPEQRSLENFARQLQVDQSDSRLVGEAVAAGVSCAGAILGWIGVVGAATVIPLTGGASTAAIVLTVGAAVATTAQCVNGVVRTTMEYQELPYLRYLDSQSWYVTTSAALDIVSLAGVASTASSTIRAVLTLRRTTGKNIPEILRGLNRQERARLTRELQSLKNPRVSEKVLKDMRSAGILPKRYTNTEIRKATWHQLRDVLGASLGFSGSAHSGLINGIAVGLYEGAAR